MQRRPGTARRWMYGLLGPLLIVVGVTSFAGWPRPFDPASWYIPLMICGLGLHWSWQALVPGPSTARTAVVGVLFALVVAGYLEVLAWPF